MKPADLVAYARRDWAAVAAAKARSRLEEYERSGAVGALRLVDQLQLDGRGLHPARPSEAERRADLLDHAILGSKLRRVRIQHHD